MPLTRLDVEFTKDGDLFRPSQMDALSNGLAGVTDLLVLAHGWNNDMADARALYDELVGNISKLLDARADNAAPENLKALAGRQYAVCQVFWPSMKFADEDLIPGGGAATATVANDRALTRTLEALKHDPSTLGGGQTAASSRVEVIDRAIGLVPRLDSSQEARREFVGALRSLVEPGSALEIDDGSADYFRLDPERLFERLSGAVVAPAPTGKGGATTVEPAGGAAGLKDLAVGAVAGARRIANFTTYYQMKTRAGLVGHKGLSALLKRCRAAYPDLRLHLVGHSFGGRLVIAAAAALDPNTKNVTISLLQAAFSHNGLSADFGQGKPGGFRPVISEKRASGPIIVTHTKSDSAVGVAYPLASRIANQVAAALGDANDPYGGMGRNGAQRTKEAEGHATELGLVGHHHVFTPGTVNNLLADGVIKDHNDVRSGPVAYAVLCCSGGI
jgi:pimeloyl-ACP methyl ester carboxylesterase